MNTVEPRTVPQDFIHPILPDRQRQEFIEHDPLIVPPDLLLGLLEDFLGGTTGIGRVGAQPIDDSIMKFQHGEMKLADEQILIVSAVCDDRIVVGIAGQIEPLSPFSGNLLRPGMASTLNLMSPELVSYSSGDPAGPFP